MAHPRTLPEAHQTALERLQAKMAAERTLLQRIGRAHDAGDMAEVRRLWAEIEQLPR